MAAPIEADDSNFDSEVLRAKGAVLVDFSATWCGPCKRLDPIVHEIATAYGDRLMVVKVDVDRSPATAARFAVLSVPTLVFFKDVVVRDQALGLLSRTALGDRVDRVL